MFFGSFFWVYNLTYYKLGIESEEFWLQGLLTIIKSYFLEMILPWRGNGWIPRSRIFSKALAASWNSSRSRFSCSHSVRSSGNVMSSHIEISKPAKKPDKMSILAKNCPSYKTFIILATCAFHFFLQNPLLVRIHRQNFWSFGCLGCHGWWYRRCIHRRNWLQALRCHWYIWNFVCWSVLGTTKSIEYHGNLRGKNPMPPLPRNPIKGLSYFLGGVALGGTLWLCEWGFRRLLKEATSKSSLFGMWSVFGKNWCQP